MQRQEKYNTNIQFFGRPVPWKIVKTARYQIRKWLKHSHRWSTLVDLGRWGVGWNGWSPASYFGKGDHSGQTVVNKQVIRSFFFFPGFHVDGN